MSCLNVPYLWGGSNPIEGMDCSGFIQWCHAAIGMDPAGDQTAQGLHDHFKKTGITFVNPRPGALIFYGSPISHVALCISEQLVIEAGGGDHTTINRSEAAKRSACVRIRPYTHRRDIAEIVLPAYASWMVQGG